MGKRNRHSKPKQQIDNNPLMNLTVGDSIVVKPGVKDPDYGRDIGGWQGRVTEIESNQDWKVTIIFQWDSLSLKAMPASMIRHDQEKELDWTTLGLYTAEVESAEPRDSQEDVDTVIQELSAEHAWDHLGNQGQRIHQVLRDVNENDDLEEFEAWQEYLETHLKLPFEAEVSETQERGPLRFGDRVKVISFEGAEDLYGILVNVQVGH